MYCSLRMSFSEVSDVHCKFEEHSTNQDSYDWVMIRIVNVVRETLNDLEHVCDEVVFD